MTHDEEEDWPTQITNAVIAEITRLRRKIGLTAQELSDECDRLGLTVPRNVIANWESGRRKTITLPELLVIAEALLVSPAALVFPPWQGGSVDYLPEQGAGQWWAFSWFTGEEQTSYSHWRLSLYREHAQIYSRLQTEHHDAYQLQFRRRREDWPPGAEEKYERLVEVTRDQLLPVRARMHQLGLLPPRLSSHLAFLDEEIPPLNTNTEEIA
ncbi:helix-turn-helix transcriptional regulator [Kitasatospora sp. MAP5-34]|uniref:helix-turn-helix domain-containing protein n=1 Tax=Kitasatospora sp. MAP5-34 TaxID=3035102 RepID=UPI0024733C99|nr:helix-turn-helix transcriptional regulator [Kitasatospora sp. MAP5-34]MDH6577554.1 transcriptional regulator with XRE-family HTH domain [Kitasatospora sp. MAP5-34]